VKRFVVTLWILLIIFPLGQSSAFAAQAGINWTSRSSAADNQWWSVVYGNGIFVAVSNTGNNNRVMTSPDGITWTSRTSAADNQWTGIAFGNDFCCCFN
jgi:hypothetical protein